MPEEGLTNVDNVQFLPELWSPQTTWRNIQISLSLYCVTIIQRSKGRYSFLAPPVPIGLRLIGFGPQAAGGTFYSNARGLCRLHRLVPGRRISITLVRWGWQWLMKIPTKVLVPTAWQQPTATSISTTTKLNDFWTDIEINRSLKMPPFPKVGQPAEERNKSHLLNFTTYGFITWEKNIIFYNFWR